MLRRGDREAVESFPRARGDGAVEMRRVQVKAVPLNVGNAVAEGVSGGETSQYSRMFFRPRSGSVPVPEFAGLPKFACRPGSDSARRACRCKIMYQPPAGKPEFIEVWNITSTPLDMAIKVRVPASVQRHLRPLQWNSLPI